MNFLNSIFDEQYLTNIVEEYVNEELTQKHENLIHELKTIIHTNHLETQTLQNLFTDIEYYIPLIDTLNLDSYTNYTVIHDNDDIDFFDY